MASSSSASAYSFPMLTRKEIVGSLSDSDVINIGEQDLLNPKPELFISLYTNILIYLDPLQDDNGQADFQALGRLDNPDLHVDSVRIMNLLRKIKELLAAVRCQEHFTLKDLIKPDKDRTRVFLSAIINFFYFRQTKLTAIEDAADQELIHQEKKKELDARIMQLKSEILEIDAAREREQPYVLEADAKVKELRQTIQGLNNHQVSLKATFRALRDKAKDLDEKITTADFALAQSAQENAKLQSKIVQSPEKLQGALEEKRILRDEVKNSERLAMQSFEEKTTTLEVYSKACRKMAKHLTQMQAIQEQVTNAKTIDKDVKTLKSKISDENVLDKSLEAKILERQGQAEQLKESLKALEKERNVKYEEATKELNGVKLEIESKKRNMESREKKVDATYAEVDEIDSKIKSVRESGLLKQQELHRSSEEILKEFHSYSHTIGEVMRRIEEAN